MKKVLHLIIAVVLTISIFQSFNGMPVSFADEFDQKKLDEAKATKERMEKFLTGKGSSLVTEEDKQEAKKSLDAANKTVENQTAAKVKAKADKDIRDASRNFYSGKLSNKDQQALFSKEGITKTLLPRLATWITGFLAAISVLFLMYAGYEYMTAGGEEEKLTHARNTAFYVILGVILMMFAYALVYLFLTLFSP